MTPASYAQEGMWLLEQLTDDPMVNAIPMGWRVDGPLEVAAFTAAVRLVAARNPALLSVCAWDEASGTLRTHESFHPDDVPVRHTRSDDARAALAELYQEALRPWDDDVPLFRAHVWTTPDESYVLMVLSHLIFDGGSEDSFFDEIALGYEHLTTGTPMPEPPPPFSRFAIEQRKRFAAADQAARVDRAAGQLAVPQPAQLPGSPPGGVRVHPSEGIRHYTWLTTELLGRLRQVARPLGASDAIVVLAGFIATAARLSGQEACSVLLPYVNRAAAWTRTVIGPCLNSLFVTAPVDTSAGFREVLERVRDASFASYAVHDVPAEALQARWARAGAEPRTNLMLNVFSQDRTPLRLPGCSTRWLTREQVPVRVRADLCVYGWPEERGLRLEFLYRLARFGAADVASLAASMVGLLTAAAEDPDAALDTLALDGCEQTRRALGEPLAATAYPSVVHQVRDAAARWPDRIAVASSAGDWTYAQLTAAADRVAGRLLDLGLRPADAVAVQGRHDRRLVATALGVLRAGGVLMLAGPDQPAARRDAVHAIARPALVVGAGPGTTTGLDDLLADGPARTLPDPATLSPDAPAYVFFTSGSTGVPKGVLGRHGGLGQFLAWERGLLGAAPGDRVGWRTNLEFDVVLRDLFLPLVAGATLVVPDVADLGDPASMLRWLDRESVTLLHITPSLADVLLAERDEQPAASARPRALRAVLFAGEPLTAHTVRRWRDLIGDGARLFNLYGPTETTLAKCVYEVPDVPAPGVQPVGVPLPETQVVILNAAGRPAATGEPGEISIRTPHRTLGYLGAADADAARFRPNPYRRDAADLLYRTGDSGRVRADGLIEILGRTDDELKIHGVRVQPAEVTTALRAHPDVDRAVVVKRTDGHGLVAYVVPRPGARPAEAAVLRWAAGLLPAAAVPSRLVIVDSLPLLPNGKVDRRALPPATPRADNTPLVAPRDAVEAAVVDAFREVLDLPRLSVHTEFLALGGHSLLAMRVAARLRQRLRVRVPATAILDGATPAAIAAWIRRQDADPRRQVAVDGRHHADEPYPAGYAQQRMFFLEQLTDSEPGVYTIPWCFRLTGPLDQAALERAVTRLVERHAPLRTGFEVTPDGLVARPRPARDVLEWSTVRLSGPAELVGWVQAETHRRLDVRAGRCLRATLAELGPDDRALLLAVHHIAADGWSLAVTQAELSTLYGAELTGTAGPEPLRGGYADFAAWQRVRVATLEADGTLARVAEHLRGAPQVYGMPTDRPRGPRQTYRGSRVTVELSDELAAALRAEAARRAVTPFALVCAVFVAALACRGRDTDLVLGTAVANRPEIDDESLIGCFINTVPMRVALPASGLLDDLVTTVAAEAARALRHAEVPFERLLTELDVPRTLNTSPLFQAMLVMRQAEPANLTLRGLTVSPVPDARLTAKTDLSLVAWLDGTQPELALEYNNDLFEAATADRMLGHITYLLERIAGGDPDRYDELPPAQLAEELAAAAGPRRTPEPTEPSDLMTAIRRTAARTPDAPAVADGQTTLGYARLVELAETHAAYLHDLGVRPGDVVAVHLERSAGMVVALVSVLAAGAAYLPLDTGAPLERIGVMLATADVRVAITDADPPPWGADGPRTMAIDLAATATHREPVSVPAGGPAYCIFTSGSTGTPKGVMVSHPAILNRLRWMQEAYLLDPTDTVLQKTPYTFDVSVWEFFWPLLAGARIVTARPGGHRDPGYLLELISRERVTVLHFVPAMLATLLEQPGAGARMSGVRLVVCSGEALEPGLRDRFYAILGAAGEPPRLENLYGPTEAAVDVSRHTCRPADGPVVPIGLPIDNIQMHVLDRRLRPVPRGGIGELHLGGIGLATGYVGRADLTADRFVPDPFGDTPGGARLYRTGDLARRRASGDIEYLGRIDFQVKLRGVRIELGEIETHLAAQPEVADAVATVRTRTDGGRELVAYAVPRPGARADQDALLNRLRAFLPDIMCPSLIMFLPELPLGTAGKVDRSALPDPSPARPRAAAHEPPATEQERALAEIWADVLKLESPVGALDGFFAVGGDSLSAIRVVGALSDRGWALSLDDVFTARTLRDLAGVLRPAEAEPDREGPLAEFDMLSDADRTLLAYLIGTETQDRPDRAEADRDARGF